jgi:uncharacterized protein (TIGR02594 family)
MNTQQSATERSPLNTTWRSITRRKAISLLGGWLLAETGYRTVAAEIRCDNRPMKWLSERIGYTNENSEVREWIRKAAPSNDSESVAWCGIAVGVAVQMFGYPLPQDHMRARSWAKAGVPTDKPEQGDIVVFWRRTRNGDLGHVAFFLSQTETEITVLGGNQDGGRVSMSTYKKNPGPNDKKVGFLAYRRLRKA